MKNPRGLRNVSFHPYQWSTDPLSPKQLDTQDFGDGWWGIGKVPRMMRWMGRKSTLRAFGVRKVPKVWITEFAYMERQRQDGACDPSADPSLVAASDSAGEPAGRENDRRAGCRHDRQGPQLEQPASRRPCLPTREPVMRRAATALMWTQAGWSIILILYALFGKGRPEANVLYTVAIMIARRSWSSWV